MKDGRTENSLSRLSFAHRSQPEPAFEKPLKGFPNIVRFQKAKIERRFKNGAPVGDPISRRLSCAMANFVLLYFV